MYSQTTVSLTCGAVPSPIGRADPGPTLKDLFEGQAGRDRFRPGKRYSGKAIRRPKYAMSWKASCGSTE